MAAIEKDSRRGKRRNKTLRWISWCAALALGIPLAYVLAALGLAFIPVNAGFVDAADGVELFLVSNGVHVDFLVPVKSTVEDWSQKLPRKDFRGVDESFSGLLLGWGNRGFYLETPTWSDLKVSTALHAIFLPSASVVHAQYVDWHPVGDAYSRKVRISESAYRDLCAYLEASFQKDANGKFLLIPNKGYGDADNFYEGVGSYHAFNTCNLWTNRGLKQIGVRTALWSPFAGGILRQLPGR
jgi:uncharacterized protein (TIGR02117 family)